MVLLASGVSSYVQAVALGLGVGLSPCEPSSLCSISSDDDDDISIGGVPRLVRDDATEVIRIAPVQQLNYRDFLTRLQEMERVAKTQFVTDHFEGHNDDRKLGPEYVNTVISRGPGLRLVSIAIKHYDASFNPDSYARSPGEVLAFALSFYIKPINQRLIIPTTDSNVVQAMHQGIIAALQAHDEAQDAHDWLRNEINAMGTRGT